MAVSKKLTDLTQALSTAASSLLYIVVDPTGTPTDNSISIKQLFESNVTANVTANGSLVVNELAVANAVMVRYNSTPANSTAVPSGFSNNTVWCDGSYLYVVTGSSQIKRVAISTW